ncbi:hypothetical protein V6N11_083310 [Hibiscus sabdariffa]|uniref:Uncharacterized protein n=1 Tax=Hibiscus sabdariffa TaxID=183260 RepID=A0ABR2QLI6_9ROSI
MVPTHSFLNEISSCLIATVPAKFYDKDEEEEIKLQKAPSFSFCNHGVPLKTTLPDPLLHPFYSTTGQLSKGVDSAKDSTTSCTWLDS